MNALKYSYEELKQRHIAAYKKLYDRVEVCIDGDDYENVPTDVRIENVKNGVVDNKLTQLLFDYGRLTTCSSTAPENSFIYNGIVAAAAEGAAMDLSIIIDYLTYMIELSPIIGNDKEKYEKMLSEMKPLSIGSDGRLLEYGEEFEEFEPGHRHLSHLYGVYPAYIIKEGTDLFEAARKAMEGRIANNIDLCGWTYAWLVSLYSRFKDGEKANFYIKGMFKNVIFPNLFDSCPPFQIDGNYGICAGICEMLMQSHTGTIELIPAIPKEWKSGHVKGMKARGGKTVSFAWKDGKIISSEIV